jgi:hypothetical protein
LRVVSALAAAMWLTIAPTRTFTTGGVAKQLQPVIRVYHAADSERDPSPFPGAMVLTTHSVVGSVLSLTSCQLTHGDNSKLDARPERAAVSRLPLHINWRSWPDCRKHERRRLPFFETAGDRIETRGVVCTIGDERALGIHASGKFVTLQSSTQGSPLIVAATSSGTPPVYCSRVHSKVRWTAAAARRCRPTRTAPPCCDRPSREALKTIVPKRLSVMPTIPASRSYGVRVNTHSSDQSLAPAAFFARTRHEWRSV